MGADEEWDDWEAGLPTVATGYGGEPKIVHPDPHEDNGIPDGWRVWSRYAEFNPDTDLVLVQRLAGGWMTLYRHRVDGVTFIADTYPTLLDMFDTYLEDEKRFPIPARNGRDANWMRRVLGRLYDPNDPDEEAEALMVALGGRPTAPPRVTLPN